MHDLFWLSDVEMDLIEGFFPLSHGVPRVDDRKTISGVIFVITNGVRWRDAPAEYGPHKTIYNRFIRWTKLGVFNNIFATLVGSRERAGRPVIGVRHLQMHRTTSILLAKGMFPDVDRLAGAEPQETGIRSGSTWSGSTAKEGVVQGEVPREQAAHRSRQSGASPSAKGAA